MALTIQIVGADKLSASLGKAASSVNPELKGALTKSLLLIESDARRNAVRDTGRLQNSITHSISGNGLEGKVGPSVAYGLYVEMGRRPGKPPPIAAVAAWAQRHGINPFLVARAIGRKGIKARPFLVPAFEKNKGRIEQAFAAVGAKVLSQVKGA
jgi:HK97 gp10 family phage protein